MGGESCLNVANSLIGGLVLKGRTEEAELIFYGLRETNCYSQMQGTTRKCKECRTRTKHRGKQGRRTRTKHRASKEEEQRPKREINKPKEEERRPKREINKPYYLKDFVSK